MNTERKSLLDFAAKIAIILAGFGIFYHFVIYEPNKEEAARLKVEAAQKAEVSHAAERKQAYQACMADASFAYNLNWASACEDVAKTAEENYKTCVQNTSTDNKYCRTIYPSKDSNPNCTLPGQRAERIEKWGEDARKKCMEEAKSGL